MPDLRGSNFQRVSISRLEERHPAGWLGRLRDDPAESPEAWRGSEEPRDNEDGGIRER
jgi:hypothetical protein